MNRSIITVDVEDWSQSTWDRSLSISSRSADNTLKLLDLLDELNIKTTMFVLGKFAKTFPDIVKKIDNAGHEVASHGYSHIEIFKQTKGEFKDDLIKSKNLLQNIIGKKVIGYRAPDFSIIKKTIWALEILGELEFDYDSSIYPIKHKRYGIEDFSAQPVKLISSSGMVLFEFPIATMSLYSRNIPVGGGGYHRLFPFFMIKYFAKKILKENYFIYYCHPYEFDKNELSEIPFDIPLKTKLHQGLGRGHFRQKFVSFVSNFGSIKIRDILGSENFPEYKI